MLTKAQRQAIQNLADSVDTSAKLPHRVLAAEYAAIYVMDFERLLRQNTVDLLKSLMKYEGSTTLVVAKFEEITRETQDWRDDVFFVSLLTEADAYWSFVRRNIAEYGQKRVTPEMKVPWLIFAERIGVCSDLGSWCIYGQKFSEIALLGFKRSPSAFLEKKFYFDFRIERLADALKRDTFFGDPGNEYSKQQRSILRAAYLR